MPVKMKTLAQVTLTTAGTSQRLVAAPNLVLTTTISASPSNSGYIYVGDSNVSSTRYAARLAAGEFVVIDGPSAEGGSDSFDLYDIYIDGSASSDKVMVAYQERD